MSHHHINLTAVKSVLFEVVDLVDGLDGQVLDETGALSQGRAERAELSRNLSLLADRLELAAAMTRSEYWTARGYPDHINTRSTEQKD